MLDYMDILQVWYSDGVVFEIKAQTLSQKKLLVIREYDYDMHRIANVIPYIINTEAIEDTIPNLLNKNIYNIQDLIEVCDELHSMFYNQEAEHLYCYLKTNVIADSLVSFAQINIPIPELNTGTNWICILTKNNSIVKKEITEFKMLDILNNFRLLDVLFGNEAQN